MSQPVNLPVLTGDSTKDQTSIRKALLALNQSSSGGGDSNLTRTPLTNPITGNTSYNLSAVSSGVYSIYISKRCLIAANGGGYLLSILSSGSQSASVPISTAGDIINSGDLFFQIYIDQSGNVTAGEYSISGSNSNGTYIKFGDGTMICSYMSSTSYATSLSFGSIFYGIFGMSFPATFSDVPIISDTCKLAYGVTWPAVYDNATVSGFTLLLCGAASNTAAYVGYIAIGRWRK